MFCTRWVWAMLMAALVLPGCLCLERARPLAVLVRDAETGQPIAGAQVTVSYPIADGPWSPTRSTATTDEAGIARVQATPARADIVLEASADGYLFEWRDLSADALRKIEPAHWFEKVDRRAVSEVLELYRGPHPTVEFVVPVDYHGRFRARTVIQDDAPMEPGERCFRCAVPAEGDEVTIVAPAVLRHGGAPDFRARLADGTLLTRNVIGPQIGFWYLKYDDGYDYFLVGTARQYAAWRSAEEDASHPPQRHAGDKGGKGRGRRGRGGM